MERGKQSKEESSDSVRRIIFFASDRSVAEVGLAHFAF